MVEELSTNIVGIDKQESAKPDTALLCLMAAAGSMGIAVKEEEIRKECGLSEAGVMDTDTLIRVAKKIKLKAEIVSPKPEKLPEQPIPAIAILNNGNYVVVGQSNEEKIIIYDPCQGKPTVILLDEFVNIWSGQLILLKRPFSMEELGRKLNFAWFKPAFVRYKKFFWETFAASFFLQIFGLAAPLCTQVIIDKVLAHRGVATLDVLAVVLLVIALFQTLMGILRTYIFTHTTNKIDTILGTRLFRHIAALPLRYFELRRVGDTLMRVGAMNTIREFLTGQAMTSVMDTVFSLVFIAVMFYYNVSLTLIALAAIPLVVLQNIIVTPIFMKRLSAVWGAGAENNAFLVETITGMHTVKSLALEPQFNYKWEQLLNKYVRATFNNGTFNNIVGNSSSLIQRLSGFSILWFGGHMVMEGEMTVGQLIAFQMLANQATTPLFKLAGMWQTFHQTALSVERLGDVINTPPEQAQNQVRPMAALQGGIAFQGVTFRYNPEAPPVLNEISLNIVPGMSVGVVGRSGSGKSTLAKLVQRLYLPESGQVLIDGQDIATVDPAWLRRQIGVVLQENYLFNGSIRDNISIARPSASMEEVIRVAQIAGAHEFILEMPEGYDTNVGERGTALSGGQRQRIAIARALLNNPRILIFDEATSALDYQSERIITQNMGMISAGRTVFTVAHRLSTVRRCDLIIVVDHGKVVEQGTHEQLIAFRGLYYNLYSIQQEV